jgi:hypothetical protein
MRVEEKTLEKLRLLKKGVSRDLLTGRVRANVISEAGAG